MTTPERPTFPSGQRVTAEWLQKQPNLNNTDVFIKVTGMVQRSVRDVLGDSLEREAINHLQLSPRYNTNLNIHNMSRSRGGAEAFHAIYAHTVAAVTKAMGWDEGDPQLTFFCLTLYEKIVSKNQSEGTSQTLDRLRSNMRNYLFAHGSQVDIKQNELLSVIFDMPKEQRNNVYKLFRKSETRERAFQKLKEYKKEHE